jgi:hypothetical protein
MDVSLGVANKPRRVPGGDDTKYDFGMTHPYHSSERLSKPSGSATKCPFVKCVAKGNPGSSFRVASALE